MKFWSTYLPVLYDYPLPTPELFSKQGATLYLHVSKGEVLFDKVLNTDPLITCHLLYTTY
jgi:hypothetical protein